MSSKRRIKKRSCRYKRRYTDIKLARYHAHLLREKEQTTIKAYRCKFCNSWHVGHTPYKLK